jgi:hypothetical protein
MEAFARMTAQTADGYSAWAIRRSLRWTCYSYPLPFAEKRGRGPAFALCCGPRCLLLSQDGALPSALCTLLPDPSRCERQCARRPPQHSIVVSLAIRHLLRVAGSSGRRIRSRGENAVVRRRGAIYWVEQEEEQAASPPRYDVQFARFERTKMLEAVLMCDWNFVMCRLVGVVSPAVALTH